MNTKDLWKLNILNNDKMHNCYFSRTNHFETPYILKKLARVNQCTLLLPCYHENEC